ncbi:family 43 glycosylhydrolase [Haoranjiania flava]|uniref:Family 43 glycosylhydrolase n=1 Tax=Haoranjiania flava TaxID=1856322 RepID=A0AAE3LJV7_9BACT|nr:family 43 glycosylhydrolase [Haoranjiania flava]MCU7693764.1 family 43 glycosylhydrolase [Haoranjiania flava]
MQAIGLIMLSMVSFSIHAQQTYCNPLNIDYTYMVYNAYNDLSYRSGADPAVVSFRGEYYMFVTRSMGYWHSKDLLHWQFIAPEKWYFQGSNAPAAFNYKDSVLYVMGDPSGSMSVLYTDDPKKGDWKAVPGILNDLQDPALFIDDDGKTYLYWGSSNVFPIRGRELNKNDRFKPLSARVDSLFYLDMSKHGWERFGENHADTVLGGYMEGPWMTKHNGKYYLQYGAPGTEFNVYGDGAYVSNKPLGPFQYMPNNPFSYKPGGFMNGAGHGSTVVGPGGKYWHFASMAMPVNVNWERRLCMYATYFDKDGLMYSDTYFGDYPHFAPATGERSGKFTGWMLLSYNKPVKASGYRESYTAKNVTDENAKTFWLAPENNDQQWVEIDLQHLSEVRAIQINYNDYKSGMYGRIKNLYHRYIVEGSVEGKSWFTIVDKSRNFQDVPNDYVALADAVKTRYVRFKNIHCPTPHLSISDIRVFGKGNGKPPVKVQQFTINRKTDRRDAIIRWKAQSNAQGYNVIWGIAPDKLYSSWMVYGNNELDLKALNRDQEYYFTIEAFNEHGVGERTGIIKIE